MGYIVERAGNGVTTIKPDFKEYALPPGMAIVRPPCNGVCVVTVSVDGLTICVANVNRGKSFAERVARHMLKGVLSGLGRHRRLTANRAAKKAAEGSKEVA